MALYLVHFNTVRAELITRKMYEMLRHPVRGALNIIMKRRTIATMTRGTKCNTLLQYLHTTFLMISLLGKYLGGLIAPKYSLDLPTWQMS